jgi:hypothetical protein
MARKPKPKARAAAARGKTPIRFTGRPNRLDAALPVAIAAGAAPDLQVDLDVPDAEPTVGYTARPGTNALGLRLALPDSTPAGTYRGSVTIGEEKHPAVVEIHERRRVVVTPARIVLHVALPAREAAAQLHVLNAGNAPQDLAAKQAFGLFEDHGLDRSLARAWTDAKARGVDRFGVLADELAASHGGPVRVRIDEGAGVLEPGAGREIKVGFEFHGGLVAGRGYFGYWDVGGTVCTVRVEVVQSVPEVPR